MQAQVLVVGSGPTGLVSALTLLKNGVSIRIVEKEAAHHVSSRGSGVHPRIQEIEHFLGTLSEVKALSTPSPIRRIYNSENPYQLLRSVPMAEKIEASPAFPINEPFAISQYLHEEVLRAHVAALGAQIELSTELCDIEQDDNGVIVKLLKNIDGKQEEETATFSYVVGADGGRSTVRRLIGLKFLGETYEKDQLLNSDIDLKGLEGSEQGMHIFGNHKDVVVNIRTTIVPGRYQMLIVGPNYREIASECEAADLDKLQAIVTRISGRSDLQLTKIHFKTNWRLNVRMVDHFQKGRVFVTGDAAHVHSPMGGQGMNSGIQDSFNLAWKLALVVSGNASPALLASYEEERHPVISDMLLETTRLHRRVFVDKEDQSTAQGMQDTIDLLGKAAAPILKAVITDELGASHKEDPFFRGRKLFQLEVNYRWSSIVLDERFDQGVAAAEKDAYGKTGSILQAGDRAPDAPGLVILSQTTEAEKIGKVHGKQGESVRLFDIFDLTVHTILVFSSDAGRHGELLRTPQKLPACLVRTLLIYPVTVSLPHDEDSMLNTDLILEDKEGHAFHGYGVDDTVYAVIVRPDGMIGAFAKGPGGVDKYFSKIVGAR
ncbi:hypothetical protein EW145_g1876 [Phellinidium pouzarii]|uniref:FAD-binding domain-containing protein n=1 Tax=Phellinidium pouzarii TaxID=167371 RepID=A0A4S4LD59_9AGAM|nr:hypothetical protein EW145_g1876 [Phellinidium pouzarii]